MNTKTTLPISKARAKIFKIAEEVQKPETYYTITEKGLPKAVIMSAEEFESWQETIETIREFPNLEKDIFESEKDYQKKNFIDLKELLSKNGYVQIDNSSKSSKRNRKNT